MEQRTVQAIRHIGFEDLGSMAEPLQRAGYAITYVDAAEISPGSLDPLGADILVVLGGSIGVYDHERYPVLSEEMELLRTRLAANLPTLGICLGAQLIAATLVARVYQALNKEIGWSRLELTDAGQKSALVALRDVPVLHWHGDTFDLPDGCDLLASTNLCRHRAFSRGPNILGLQFHAEPLAIKFEHWLLGHATELAAAGIDPAALRADAACHARILESRAQMMVEAWINGLSPR